MTESISALSFLVDGQGFIFWLVSRKTDYFLLNKEMSADKMTWTLWYHDPSNNDYSLESYIKIFEVTSVAEFWSLIDGIPKDVWESGMFFFMKTGIRPLWDAPENDKGGAWSKRVDAGDTHTVFIDCMVHCLAESFLKNHNDSVVGVTVSPKGQFHIVKVWNSTTAVCDRKLFSPSLKMKLGDDIAYKAHNLRPK